MSFDTTTWTRLYFTDRSPPGSVTQDGHLTSRGLFMVLADLSLSGNYGPICKKGARLYSTSDKWFPGRYYDLSTNDPATLLQAVEQHLL